MGAIVCRGCVHFVCIGMPATGCQIVCELSLIWFGDRLPPFQSAAEILGGNTVYESLPENIDYSLSIDRQS